MFNNVVLDVFISLVFIYLLYSLLATILQEMVARWLSLRTHNLSYAIRNMLEDRKEVRSNCGLSDGISRYTHMWENTFKNIFNPFPDDTLGKAFYHHPMIKYLGESQWRRKPAYLQPETFSLTLIQLLRGDQYDGSRPQIKCIEETLFQLKQIKANISHKRVDVNIESETLRHLQLIYLDSQQDIDRFKSGLEYWFNETMDRATGWYKKSVQSILLIIGLVLAGQFNIDTIAIYRLLSVNRTAREQMVRLATAGVEKYGPMVAQTGQFRPGNVTTVTDSGKERTIVRDTIFVNDADLNDMKETLQDDIKHASYLFSIPDGFQKSKPMKWTGWILTALAISLGAPFWFDLLSKLVQLRGTGPKPEREDSKTNISTSPNFEKTVG